MIKKYFFYVSLKILFGLLSEEIMKGWVPIYLERPKSKRRKPRFGLFAFWKGQKCWAVNWSALQEKDRPINCSSLLAWMINLTLKWWGVKVSLSLTISLPFSLSLPFSSPSFSLPFSVRFPINFSLSSTGYWLFIQFCTFVCLTLTFSPHTFNFYLSHSHAIFLSKLPSILISVTLYLSFIVCLSLSLNLVLLFLTLFMLLSDFVSFLLPCLPLNPLNS